MLGLACAKCIEARQIHDQFSDACDGIGAFRALEARALGQATGESVEGILTRLLAMQPTDDLKVMLEMHATLYRRLKNFPTVTIDMVLKFSLLRLFRDHPAYPRFAGIEESISQADVDYDQASRRILDAYLRAVSSQAGASALLAGSGAPGAPAPNKRCWDCGAPGKVRGDGHSCPTPGSGQYDTRSKGGGNNRNRRDGGKGKDRGLVVRLVASLAQAQGVPWVPPVWWTPPRCLPSQILLPARRTCCKSFMP